MREGGEGGREGGRGGGGGREGGREGWKQKGEGDELDWSTHTGVLHISCKHMHTVSTDRSGRGSLHHRGRVLPCLPSPVEG